MASLKSTAIATLLLFGLTLGSTAGQAASNPPRPPTLGPSPAPNPFDWLDFQVGTALATQGGGFSMGPLVQYLPQYKISSARIGLELGLASFNDVGSSAFAALQFGAFGAYALAAGFEARVAAGAQSWTSGNGTAFYAEPSLLYHLRSRWLGVLDGVFLSDSLVFQSTFANVVSAGISLKL